MGRSGSLRRMARSGLGKGLGALIGTPAVTPRPDVVESGERVHQINLVSIVPSALQPRKDFGRDASFGSASAGANLARAGFSLGRSCKGPARIESAGGTTLSRGNRVASQRHSPFYGTACGAATRNWPFPAEAARC